MQLSGTGTRSREKGMTLAEVMISLTILCMVTAGLIATMIQSRRLTEGSIRRNLATTIITSYAEQIKGLGPTSMVLNPIPTKDSDVSTDVDYLYPSSGTPPALSSLTPGTTPANSGTTTYVDNLKDFPLYTADASQSGAASTWAVIWPGATTTGTKVPYVNDLHMNVWVWISDMYWSGNNANVAAATAYQMTIIYTWRVTDGGRVKYFSDELHSVVSAVNGYGQ